MNARIQGIGWVTPLGRDVSSVWQAVQAGQSSAPAWMNSPFSGRVFPVLHTDPECVADVARHPRLRRSSAISHFAVAAALDAVRNAACDPASERLAVVFAATNGGVIYTRRFYEGISQSGTHAGSPLLFPETVYNAPASHIAAVLGVTGTVTTLVNDATAGVDALSAACELLDSGTCDRCLVVAAEEVDWAICEACAAWKLVTAEPHIVPFSGRGTIFSEGAAAVVIGAGGDGPAIERIYNGATFQTIADARRRMAGFAKDANADITISSASGTQFDEAEADLNGCRILPKVSLGEAFAASTITQVAVASLALRENSAGSRAFVPAIGLHGQVAALTLQA